MSQKIAFITGGNRGLGFQTALELKDAGVKVVIGSRDLAQGEQAVARLRAAGADADVLHFDITKPADHKAAYDYFNSRYGRLDILVNNAGIAAGAFPGNGPEHSVSGVAPDLLHKIFETNFFAQVALTRALLPLLKKSVDLLEKSYQGGGQVSFSDLLMTEQSYFATRLSLAAARQNLWLAIADVQGMMQQSVE